MPTIRKRGDSIQCIVRVKAGGVLVHQESETWKLNGQPEARIRRLARDWGLAIEARLKSNGLPTHRLKSTTLARLMELQIEELERHGVEGTRIAELKQLMPYFVRDKLDELTSHTFTKFATKRREEGAGASTVMHHLATLRATLNAAKPLHGLDIDGSCVSAAIKALSAIGAVSKSAERDRRPTPAEWEALMAYFDRMAHHPTAKIPMRKICELAVALPRRLGELAGEGGALWANHDAARHLLKLIDTKHPTKVRNEVVPLPAPARAILASLPVIDAQILPYNPESISAAFTRACGRLKIDDLHFHDLRHEGISRLFEQGLQIQEVAVISGHLSWNMLKRYTHLGRSAILEKLNSVGLNQAQETAAEPA